MAMIYENEIKKYYFKISKKCCYFNFTSLFDIFLTMLYSVVKRNNFIISISENCCVDYIYYFSILKMSTFLSLDQHCWIMLKGGCSNEPNMLQYGLLNTQTLKIMDTFYFIIFHKILSYCISTFTKQILFFNFTNVFNIFLSFFLFFFLFFCCETRFYLPSIKTN